MLDTTGIIKRIQDIMQQRQFSASAFAEKIGVQRSSISHLLSGRNKPSLDLLVKIESAFEEISFEWLLKGNENKAPNSPQPPTRSQISSGNFIKEITEKPLQNQVSMPSTDGIVSIVHFYGDGTFERYTKR